MKTLLTDSHEKAAEIIKNGGIVAFPTETVYGLGADIFDEKAIAKVFAAKGRPADNPLIAHVGNRDQIRLLAGEISQHAEKFIEAFFPGPLTVVLNKANSIPEIATAGLETIGIRMPRNDLARRFLIACENPLVAPSANLSGKPSPTRWKAVFEDLDGKIDCILKGESTEIGLESTVLDCTGDVPVILRPGAISLEQLQKLVPETEVYKPGKTEAPKSPGLKHRHYSPNARVVIVSNVEDITCEKEKCGFIGLVKPIQEFSQLCICRTTEEYARELYSFFRLCDQQNLKTIYCESVEEEGLGAALIDRLRRASE